MERIWKYIENQMEIKSEFSVLVAIILSKFHDTALHNLSLTIPALLPAYTRYHPLHLALMDGFTTLDSVGGAKKGDRISVTDLFVTVHLQLSNIWLPAILVLYAKKTSRYTAIFPKGLTPLTTGKVDLRIEAYNTLSKNIGTDAALATIKADVDTAYANLVAARGTQTGAKSTNTTSSGTLENLRIAAMNMQHRNVGFVLENFYDTKETMCSVLFDLVTLRGKAQTVFTGKMQASETKALLAHTFAATDTITVKANRIVKLYLSNIIGGTTGTAVTVPANTKTVVNVADFGVTDYANYRYLTLVNQNTLPGTFSVTI